MFYYWSLGAEPHTRESRPHPHNACILLVMSLISYKRLIAVITHSLWDKDFELSYLQLIKYIDPTTGHHEQIKIFAELTPEWKKVAGLLGLSNADILTIESAGAGRTFHACLTQVFGRWENNGANLTNYKSYPKTWRGVYNLLRDSSHTKMAKKLHDALEAKISNIRGNYSEGKKRTSKWQTLCKI